MARWSPVTWSCETNVSPELGRAAFRVAILIVLMALGLLLTLRPGSAEFAITLLTLCVGLAFIGVIALFVRVIGR
jgi:hypothetical protein